MGHFPEKPEMSPDAFRAIIGAILPKGIHFNLFRIWVDFRSGFFPQ